MTSVACALASFARFAADGRAPPAPLRAASAFVGLAPNNLILIVDLVFVPDFDLGVHRGLVAMAGLAPLVFGLVWES